MVLLKSKVGKCNHQLKKLHYSDFDFYLPESAVSPMMAPMRWSNSDMGVVSAVPPPVCCISRRNFAMVLFVLHLRSNHFFFTSSIVRPSPDTASTARVTASQASFLFVLVQPALRLLNIIFFL